MVGLLAWTAHGHPTDIDSEVEALDRLIEESRSETYEEGSALWTLAETRRLTLEVARAGLLGVRAEGKGSEKTPGAGRDAKRAEGLLKALVETEKEARAAEAEAAATGGLMQAIALVTAATARLSVARLRLAWYEATYGLGLALPAMATGGDEETAGSTEGNGYKAGAPTWADPEHPEIDYRTSRFSSRARVGTRFIGWWALEEGQSPIDDSRELTATNLSAKPDEGHFLVARCKERRMSLFYYPDTYLLEEDGKDQRMNMLVRLDQERTRREVWDLSTNSRAVFHPSATVGMQELMEHGKMFLRVYERGDHHHATFKMAGAEKAFLEVSEACGGSLMTRAEAAAARAAFKRRQAERERERAARRAKEAEERAARKKAAEEVARGLTEAAETKELTPMKEAQAARGALGEGMRPAAREALEEIDRRGIWHGWRSGEGVAESSYTRAAGGTIRGRIRVSCSGGPRRVHIELMQHRKVPVYATKPIPNLHMAAYWDSRDAAREQIPVTVSGNRADIRAGETQRFVEKLRQHRRVWLALPGLPEDKLAFDFTLHGSNSAIGKVPKGCRAGTVEGGKAQRPVRENEEKWDWLEYTTRIRDKIERSWLRPPGTPRGLRVLVRVTQIPGGEVVEVKITESSGNQAFDRSVEEAVLRASPLPTPPVPVVSDENTAVFDRDITLAFEPEG